MTVTKTAGETVSRSINNSEPGAVKTATPVLSTLAVGLSVFLLVVYGESHFDLHEMLSHSARRFEFMELDVIPEAFMLAILAAGVRFAFYWVAQHASVVKESELMQAARRDRLTGLHSRSWVEFLLSAVDTGELRFCAIIDARRFSEINNCLGYSVGDDILKEIGQRLRSVLPSAYSLARVNSDVFVAVSHVLRNEAEGRAIIEALRLRLAQPFHDDHEIQLSFAIGVTFMGDPKLTDRDIMRRADIAVHSTVGDPETAIVIYDDELAATVQRRRLIETNLRKAINNENVVPYLQPIVDAKSGEITGFEVLARWTDPYLGEIQPVEFIAVAEQSGLIGKLGEQLLTVACRRAALWPGRLKLSVNLAASDLNDPLAALRILAILGATGFPSSRLQIEVTESTQLRRGATADACIETLRQAGVHVVIDDFGTGYCSFERLAGNQFDGLKIDKSFVQGMETHADMAAIVLASLQIGKQLGLAVTAEGVETESQWQALKRMGCDMAQGYFFGKPMPLADAHRLAITLASDKAAFLSGNSKLLEPRPVFA
jgi:diguanylate cyclase (GGDEF)-like protein